MEDHHHHQEMQLLPFPNPDFLPSSSHFDPPPSLDLQLSISLTPFKQSSSDSCALIRKKVRDYHSNDGANINNDTAAKVDSTCIDALKWQAAEQIRLAAMEQAYAERVMELTRREMKLAQSEFERARSLWARAMEEVERAEKMKETATPDAQKTMMMTGGDDDPTCMEITCLSCRQKFRP